MNLDNWNIEVPSEIIRLSSTKTTSGFFLDGHTVVTLLGKSERVFLWQKWEKVEKLREKHLST